MNEEIQRIQQECLQKVTEILDRDDKMRAQWRVKQVLTQDEIMLATDGLNIFAEECYRVVIDAEDAIVSGKSLVLSDEVSSLYRDGNGDRLHPLFVYSFATTLYHVMQYLADNFELLYYKIVADAFEVKSLTDKIALAVVQRVADVLISVRKNTTETTTA